MIKKNKLNSNKKGSTEEKNTHILYLNVHAHTKTHTHTLNFTVMKKMTRIFFYWKIKFSIFLNSWLIIIKCSNTYIAGLWSYCSSALHNKSLKPFMQCFIYHTSTTTVSFRSPVNLTSMYLDLGRILASPEKIHRHREHKLHTEYLRRTQNLHAVRQQC